MHKAIAAFAAVALLCLPARAQQQTVWYAGAGPTVVTGSLVTGPTDAVVADLPGSRWATARWSVTTAGTATITTEYSTDGGVNWLASAYSKRLDAVSANPSVSPWSNNTPVAGSVWETPLPGNATQFRLRCGTSGTATVVNVGAGSPFTPGIPVVATLYDVTSAVNTDNPSGVLDFSGWNGAFVNFTSGGATTVAVTAGNVADDGTLIGGLGNTLIAAATSGRVALSRGTAGVSITAISKRMSFDTPAVAAQQTRMRIEAWR